MEEKEEGKVVKDEKTIGEGGEMMEAYGYKYNYKSGGRVIMVRHGERIDETSELEYWLKTTPSTRHHDPELTTQGRLQAKEAGERLIGMKIKASVIYASPLIRTVETAHEISKVLGIPIILHEGLSVCCAFVRRYSLKRTKFLTREELLERIPDLNLVPTEDLKKSFSESEKLPKVHRFSNLNRNRKEIEIFGQHFNSNVYSLTKKFFVYDEESRDEVLSKDEDVLIVTHREGIRELSVRATSNPINKTPYCCIATFELKSLDTKWGYVYRGTNH